MNTRIEFIQQIIRERKVRSQEELATLLAEKGIRTTQATLSRDLHKLQIFKQHDASGSYYAITPASNPTVPSFLLSDSRASESMVSVDISGQLCVIKTLPGCANMAGALVDEQHHPALMGTIAGDDTLLLMLREGYDRADFLTFLARFIPNLSAKRIDKTI